MYKTERFVATVSQVNRRISIMLKNDKELADIYVRGEVSNFVNHYKTGHMYFTLKDGESTLKCVMFSNYAQKLPFLPENGMSVTARGRIQVYERDGSYQLYATEMETEGEGALYAAFLRDKTLLEKEGVFSKKRQLPQFPREICVITSAEGAAYKDIIKGFSIRYPILKIILIPALVQGRDAPQSLINALEKAQDTNADFIVLARGGGSVEDLWAFNNADLARAIYRSKIPTVSAVGHEVDYTIADFAADLRVPTPTAVAALTVPDVNELISYLDSFQRALAEKARRLPEKMKKEIEKAESDIREKIKRLFNDKQRRLKSAEEIIDALNPNKILLRGYAAVFNNKGEVIKKAENVEIGENLTVKLGTGELVVTVREKAEK